MGKMAKGSWTGSQNRQTVGLCRFINTGVATGLCTLQSVLWQMRIKMTLLSDKSNWNLPECWSSPRVGFFLQCQGLGAKIHIGNSLFHASEKSSIFLLCFGSLSTLKISSGQRKAQLFWVLKHETEDDLMPLSHSSTLTVQMPSHKRRVGFHAKTLTVNRK